MEYVKAPISTVEHSTKILATSSADPVYYRNASGSVVTAEPLIVITAEFRGDWPSEAARYLEMQKTIEAIMDAYESDAMQSKAQ